MGSTATTRRAHAAITTLLTTATIPAVVSASCHALGRKPPSVHHHLGARPADHEQERLEFRRDAGIERAQTGDSLRVSEVLDDDWTRRWNVTAPTNAGTGKRIWVAERPDALALEFGGYRCEVDSLASCAGERSSRRFGVSAERSGDLAVVDEGRKRLLGHRVHDLGPISPET